MKTLTFKNAELTELIKDIQLIQVQKQKVRRGKAKLLKALTDKHQEFLEDFQEINKKYFEVNEDDQLKRDKSGNLIYLEGVDKKQADEEVKELMDEEAGINLVEYESKVKAFYEALEQDEVDIKDYITVDGSRRPAEFNDIAFDKLMDELEAAFEPENDKGEDK